MQKREGSKEMVVKNDGSDRMRVRVRLKKATVERKETRKSGN